MGGRRPKRLQAERAPALTAPKSAGNGSLNLEEIRMIPWAEFGCYESFETALFQRYQQVLIRQRLGSNARDTPIWLRVALQGGLMKIQCFLKALEDLGDPERYGALKRELGGVWQAKAVAWEKTLADYAAALGPRAQLDAAEELLQVMNPAESCDDRQSPTASECLGALSSFVQFSNDL